MTVALQANLMTRRWPMVAGLSIALVAGAAYFMSNRAPRVGREPPEISHRSRVERVYSGHRVKLRSGDRFTYAGIRAPYSDELLHAEARKLNTELVEGNKVRLRFDEQERGRNGELEGYLWSRGKFVNEALVREGLAYVRLTPNNLRFAKELLAAQSLARRNRKGLWRTAPHKVEASYPADPKYGNFHRPSCAETPKINPARLVTFSKRRHAFDKGFAPCGKCRP